MYAPSSHVPARPTTTIPKRASYAFTGPAAQGRLLDEFWGPVSAHIKALNPRLRVAVAPYFFDNANPFPEIANMYTTGWLSLSAWELWWERSLGAVGGIDWIIPQDGRGNRDRPVNHKLAVPRNTELNVVFSLRSHASLFTRKLYTWYVKFEASNCSYQRPLFKMGPKITHVTPFH